MASSFSGFKAAVSISVGLLSVSLPPVRDKAAFTVSFRIGLLNSIFHFIAARSKVIVAAGAVFEIIARFTPNWGGGTGSHSLRHCS